MLQVVKNSNHHDESYGSCPTLNRDDGRSTGSFQNSQDGIESDDSYLMGGTFSIDGLKNVGDKRYAKKLGLGALVVLIYYEVSGGPFGIEDIVRAGGPLYALLGFSLFLVWVIPEALITAELSTAMPEASGAVGK